MALAFCNLHVLRHPLHPQPMLLDDIAEAVEHPLIVSFSFFFKRACQLHDSLESDKGRHHDSDIRVIVNISIIPQGFADAVDELV